MTFASRKGMGSLPLFLFSTVVLLPPASADIMDLPLEIQVPLVVKILTYDQNLSARAPAGTVIIGIVYSSAEPDSVRIKEEFISTAARLKLTEMDGIPISWSMIDLEREGEPWKSMSLEDFAAVYVTPGSERSLEAVIEASRKNSVATFTGLVPTWREGSPLDSRGRAASPRSSSTSNPRRRRGVTTRASSSVSPA